MLHRPLRGVPARLVFVLLALLLATALALLPIAQAQEGPAAPKLSEPFSIEGHWTGAYVRGGAVQQATATVTTVNDTPRVALTNEEWAYFGSRDPAIGDVPATAASLDSLWARRYDYDPAEDLRQMDMPILAFYGAEDRIVPPAENAPLMRRVLSENENARVVVVPETGHGLGQGSEMRTLSTPDGRYDTHY